MMKNVYSGNVLKVYEKDGRDHTYEIVELRDSVIILPVTESGEILFIKEFRGIDGLSKWKPVTGFIEPEFSPEENAQKELQEEIGYKAGKMTLIHKLDLTGTIRTNKYYFLAENLEKSKIINPDGEELIEEVASFSLEDLIRESLSGKIKINIDTLGIFLLYFKRQLNGEFKTIDLKNQN